MPVAAATTDRAGSRRPLEILAPVGSPDMLTAALRTGADAVYLGVGKFHARQHTTAFTDTAFREAVSVCHAYGVKVHVTLNTLVREEELPQALDTAALACEAGADALIVQDLGLARAIRRAAPDMPLHASTQLSCHTPAGVRALARLGFSRVVLARELSREEIAACAGQGCELEVFAHGALCMCVSGQCYFSAMLGGRSGNRGLCAQPCRLPFTPAGSVARAADSAALSLKDLSLAAHVDELRSLGVCSLKIEGRMKRPEYVAAACAVYSRAARGLPVDPALLRDLQAVFSRSGFTDGYYTARRGAAMFGVRRKEDVDAAPAAIRRLQQLYRRDTARVPVSLSFTARAGEPLRLTVSDSDGHAAEACGDPPAIAVSGGLTEERVRAQLQKTGGTPFAVHSLSCDVEPGVTAPAAALNACRRQALAALWEQRAAVRPVPFDRAAALRTAGSDPAAKPEKPAAGRAAPLPAMRPGSVAKSENPAAGLSDVQAAVRPAERPVPLWARLRDPGQWSPELAEQVETVFLPLCSSAPGDLLSAGREFGVELPRALFGQEREVRQRLQAAVQRGVRLALCHTADALELAAEAGLQPVCGFGANAANREALEALAAAGAVAATWSMELAFSQMPPHAPLPAGALVYGRQPLMLTRNCPRQAATGCRGCGGQGGLVDRRGTVFPIECHLRQGRGYVELLNSAPLYWADRLSELPRLDFWLLHFTGETAGEAAAMAGFYRHGGPPREGITRGMYRRGVE